MDSGDQARKKGRYERAVKLYWEALKAAERSGQQDRCFVAIYTNLGLAFSKQGKYVEAESLYQRVLAMGESTLELEHAHRTSCLSNLAALYYRQGRYAEAEALYRRVLAIDERVLGSAHPEVAADLNNLGALYNSQGKYAEAEPLLRRALSIQEQAFGADHPDVATTLNNLAFLCEDQGRHAEAEPLYRRALAIVQRTFGPAHPDVALCLNNLASLSKEQGKYQVSESLYRQALAIRKKALGPTHPDVATSMENYASLLRATRQTDKAEKLLAGAEAIRARHAEEILASRWRALPLTAPSEGGQAAPSQAPPLSTSAAMDSALPWPLPGPYTQPPQALLAETSDIDVHTGLAAGELLESELQRAIELRELEIYYQPVVSLASGQITGTETLLRWQHPRRGLLSPIDFLPLAEKTGLIFTIGEKLLQAACAQQMAWSAAGYPSLRILVNLSERQFRDQNLPKMIRKVLKETGMAPEALQLEITESVALQDIESSVRAFTDLRATGVRLALDDVSADDASLARLERFPIDTIKLDRSLVRQIPTDPDGAAGVASMIALAHERGWKVTALGVETEEQLAFLRGQPCDEIQGYLFRRAAPADSFTLLLQQGQCLPPAFTPDTEARRLCATAAEAE